MTIRCTNCKHTIVMTCMPIGLDIPFHWCPCCAASLPLQKKAAWLAIDAAAEVDAFLRDIVNEWNQGKDCPP